MERAPAKLFIAYAAPDRAYAERLAAELLRTAATRGQPISIFFNAAGVQIGDPILTTIAQQIAESDAFVFVVSNNLATSEYARSEVTLAVSQYATKGKRIIPVVLGSFESMPPLLRPYAAVDGKQDIAKITSEILNVVSTTDYAPADAENHQRDLLENLPELTREITLRYQQALEEDRRTENHAVATNFIAFLALANVVAVVALLFIQGEAASKLLITLMTLLTGLLGYLLGRQSTVPRSGRKRPDTRGASQ